MQAQAKIQTDWTALLLALLIQLPVVVWAISNWGIGLVALGPFELVRLIVLKSLGKAYRKYGDPWQTMKSFLKRAVILLAAFAFVFLVYMTEAFGLHSIFVLLSDVLVWEVIAIPVIILIAENAVNVFFFRGDMRIQAARLDAMAADALTWFGLVVVMIPMTVLVLGGFCLYLIHGQAVYFPPWVPHLFGTLFVLYPAAYFAGKAIVLAQAYTAHFARTGQRVLGAPWVLFITSARMQPYAQSLRIEKNSIEWRRAAMLGEAAPAENPELESWY